MIETGLQVGSCYVTPSGVAYQPPCIIIRGGNGITGGCYIACYEQVYARECNTCYEPVLTRRAVTSYKS